jgi:hypothetical protein
VNTQTATVYAAEDGSNTLAVFRAALPKQTASR